jgi:CRISPR-associated protein Csb2
MAEETRAISAVVTALRHACVQVPATTIQVQREPFERKGTRAERFADGTRFKKERLWHVEIELAEAIGGPLVIGDGRFLGLGVMAPVSRCEPVLAFRIQGGLAPGADPVGLARALRRAVLARVQAKSGNRPLSLFFTGHTSEGRPAAGDRSSHVAFHAVAPDQLLVLSPHLLDHRPAEPSEARHLEMLDAALSHFSELLAGAAGRLELRRERPDLERDTLFAPSRTWTSVTAYTVNRHARKTDGYGALAADVRNACHARGLPVPIATVTQARGVPGRGLEGHLTLEFPVAVAGPIVLGRTRYLGGGLFRGGR